MVSIIAETWNNAGVDLVIIHFREENKPALWLIIKDIGKKIDVKSICNLVDKESKGKFNTNNPTDQQIREYKKNGSEFMEYTKFMFVHECIIIPAIMYCRVATPKSIEFRSKLGFNQYDITLTKELLKSIIVLKSIIDAFEGETMQTQYGVLGYKIDLYLHDYKLAIEANEKGHKDRNINHEIERQEAIKEKLGCELIRINPDEENFNIFKSINQICRHMKRSSKKLTEELTKESLIDETSKRLLGLEL